MEEMNFDEYVNSKIRVYEQESGPVSVYGEIDQFKPFTLIVHGKKQNLAVSSEYLEEDYMNYLDLNAGPGALRTVY